MKDDGLRLNSWGSVVRGSFEQLTIQRCDIAKNLTKSFILRPFAFILTQRRAAALQNC